MTELETHIQKLEAEYHKIFEEKATGENQDDKSKSRAHSAELKRSGDYMVGPSKSRKVAPFEKVLRS